MNVTRLHYPLAAAQLEVAQVARRKMVRMWNEQVRSGLVTEAVSVADDGSGTIWGRVDWLPGRREALTALLQGCVTALWRCLDSLVTETVEALSAQHRIRNPHKERYFPLADSVEALELMLEDSALDGVLNTHYSIVRDVQPFLGVSDNSVLQRLRRALAALLKWDKQFDKGVLVVAWATPTAPEVRAAPPAIVREVKAARPGSVDPTRDFATLLLDGYSSSASVEGRSGTFVDLHFGMSDGHEPPERPFVEQLEECILAVAQIAAAFASSIDQVAGSRGHPGASRQRTSQPTWIPAHDSDRYWSESELKDLERSALGLGVVTDAEELTLIVSTPDGVFERTIPRASPLNRFVGAGHAAEAAARDAAATWGLPDFVLRPQIERKGAGVREISDGLIVIGRRGLIIQSKAREAPGEDPSREASWINKQIKKACSQIDGTARRLAAGPVDFENGRGHKLIVNGGEVDWRGVVLIEHSNAPEDIVCDSVEARVPYVVVLRRDWEFLFEQLRSTAAVVDYVFRVHEPAETLGGEPLRYFELAQADADSTAATTKPAPDGLARHVSVPILPIAPAGADDEDGFSLFRMILEDLANIALEDNEVSHRQDLLASLDHVPVMHRAELGRLLLDELAAPASDGIRWKSRLFLAGSDTDQIGFAFCSHLNDTTQNGFRAWAYLRHHDWGTRVGSFEGLRSIAILLTPRLDGRRDWDTTLFAVSEDPELTPEQIASWRDFWGPTANPS